MSAPFSFARFSAILVKEFIQMRRDRMTFGMMIGVPILQLLLFGYAINNDPRHLPTLVEIGQSGPFARSFLAAMANSRYFDIRGTVSDAAEADAALRRGAAAFVVSVPFDFERRVVRGERPPILIMADAADPAAMSGAVGALERLVETSLTELAVGPLAGLRTESPAFEVIVHRRFNPAGITSFNIVPGLLAVILTMTMVMITAIAIVREAERGTLETLLSTPARAPEVMVGKVLPYVLVGYVQTAVFLAVAQVLFAVPFEGAALPFVVAINLFIIVNLVIGLLFSTAARNQMQAMQMSVFFLLPSILLSGFMFPFSGMPQWAQVIGTVLPTTHFIRVLREIMLKGAGLADIAPELGALAVILAAVSILAMLRYRRTLD